MNGNQNKKLHELKKLWLSTGVMVTAFGIGGLFHQSSVHADEVNSDHQNDSQAATTVSDSYAQLKGDVKQSSQSSMVTISKAPTSNQQSLSTQNVDLTNPNKRHSVEHHTTSTRRVQLKYNHHFVSQGFSVNNRQLRQYQNYVASLSNKRQSLADLENSVADDNSVDSISSSVSSVSESSASISSANASVNTNTNVSVSSEVTSSVNTSSSDSTSSSQANSSTSSSSTTSSNADSNQFAVSSNAKTSVESSNSIIANSNQVSATTSDANNNFVPLNSNFGRSDISTVVRPLFGDGGDGNETKINNDNYYGLNASTNLYEPNDELGIENSLYSINQLEGSKYYGQIIEMKQNAYQHSKFDFVDDDKKIPAQYGSRFLVRDVIIKNGVARFLLDNGYYLTANINYVKLVDSIAQ